MLYIFFNPIVIFIVPWIYNIQLGFPETEKKPTFSNLLRGYSFTADVFLERISLSEVPTDSDEATSRWLHELYVKKVHILINYIIFFKNSEFYRLLLF